MDKKYLVIGGVALAGVVLMMMMGGGGGGSSVAPSTTIINPGSGAGAQSSAGFGSFLDMPSLGGVETQTGQIIQSSWFNPPTVKDPSKDVADPGLMYAL